MSSLPSSLSDLDCVAQAELVRLRRVSPRELVAAAVARIERLNPELNAVIHRRFERALEEAASPALPDGPFRGVPFLLKDLGAPSAGDPYHAGMRFLRDADWRETEDAYLTAKLRAAGLVFLGRTNTPELGLLPTTEPEAHGVTRNPWDPARSAGGSSGGAAAAVASGMVAAAHASDGGGSIRIPASTNGLVGLKPTRARTSFGPAIGERWGGFSCEGVVSRSVRDTAAILDVVQGAMPGDPYVAPAPTRSYSAEVGAPPGRLRIGLMTVGPRGLAVHPECVAAARTAASTLESVGHAVEEAYPPPLDDPAAVGAYATVVAASTRRALDAWGARVGRAVQPADVEPLTWGLAELGRGIGAPRYLEALEITHTFGRRLAAWWASGFDLLLTPTQAEPPPVLGSFVSTREVPLQAFLRAAPFGAFTLGFNLSGQPAISLPVHWTAEGLPVGAQLVAAYGREDLLLRVAAQLEQARPWSARRPRIRA